MTPYAWRCPDCRHLLSGHRMTAETRALPLEQTMFGCARRGCECRVPYGVDGIPCSYGEAQGELLLARREGRQGA